ncbi:MAG TPA: ribbon-helix-helix protein, CopG family [Pseudolabrys sp.]|nr:ribbon-helix-helix protein, CopG family [Pseudolabrys sp.]
MTTELEDDATMNSIISLRLPTALVDELNRHAQRELITRTALIRRCLKSIYAPDEAR